MKFYSFLFLVALPFIFADEVDVDEEVIEAPRASIMAYKHTDDLYIVQNMNFTVIFDIFNVGELIAKEVEITELIRDTDFDVVEGELVKSFDEIPPGGHETYTLTVTPKVTGQWETPYSTVQYSYDDGSGASVQASRSTTLGKLTIITEELHTKLTSKYVKEWTVFGIGFAFPIILPMLMWLSLSSSNSKTYKKKSK